MSMPSRVRSGVSAGFPESDVLEPGVRAALDWVLEWTAPALALVLSGSHAAGEAVWRVVSGERLCLSDLDVYAVVPDAAARRAARGRMAAARAGLGARLRALSIAAPLELATYTPGEWETLPARPSTLELRRHGRLVSGDASWLERLPRREPRDVTPEETLLLHENRAFELLAAHGALAADDPLARARARHATLKCALDLAGVERLRAGCWEDGAAARVAAARAARGAGAEPPWDAALAWRLGAAVESSDLESEWWSTARGWVRLWSELNRLTSAERFEDVALAAGRRARLRRRLRLGLLGEARGRPGPGLGARLGRALTGTPQHRLNASAGVALAAAVAERDGAPGERAAVRARRDGALERLGVVTPVADDDALFASLVETWDRWVLDGARRGAGS
jgi:hypothetical protein